MALDSLVDDYMAGGGSSQSPGGAPMSVGGSGGPSGGLGGPNTAGYGSPVSARYGEQNSSAAAMRNTMMNQIMGMFGPEQAGLRQQGQGIMDQIGMTQLRTGTNVDFLRQNYGLDTRALGLDRSQLGIEQGAAGRQHKNTFEQERLAKAMTENQRRMLGQQYTEGVQGAKSEATAAGGFSAPGLRTGLTNLFGNLGLGVQRADLGLESDLLGIRETRASAKDRQRSLGVEAQRLGLRADQLQSQLSQGITNLNLDSVMSVNDLFSALGSNNMQQQAMARQIMDQILQLSAR